MIKVPIKVTTVTTVFRFESFLITEGLLNFDSSTMQGIAGGQTVGESLLSYKPPNLMSSFNPGESLTDSLLKGF